MSMRIEQIAKPSDLPVTLSEAKLQIGLLDSNHDALLLSFIEATTSFVEHYIKGRLVTQTVRFVGESFGPLPVAQIQTIDSIVYDDVDGVEQTLAASEYYTDYSGLQPTVEPVSDWPFLQSGKPGSVRIQATVGYGDPLDVPPDIKAAILIRVKEMFANRGETVTGMGGVAAASPITIKSLLNPYRRRSA